VFLDRGGERALRFDAKFRDSAVERVDSHADYLNFELGGTDVINLSAQYRQRHDASLCLVPFFVVHFFFFF